MPAKFLKCMKPGPEFIALNPATFGVTKELHEVLTRHAGFPDVRPIFPAFEGKKDLGIA
jgi:hypothetical protein